MAKTIKQIRDEYNVVLDNASKLQVELYAEIKQLQAENEVLSLKLKAQIAARNRTTRAASYVAPSSGRTPAQEAARAAAMASGKTTAVSA